MNETTLIDGPVQPLARRPANGEDGLIRRAGSPHARRPEGAEAECVWPWCILRPSPCICEAVPAATGERTQRVRGAASGESGDSFGSRA